MHGYSEILESIVITENDDYLDFMVRLHEVDHPILPPEITIALATNVLLFVGYSLADWNFRMLFKSLFSTLSSMTNLIMAVQLRPRKVKNENDAIRYLGVVLTICEHTLEYLTVCFRLRTDSDYKNIIKYSKSYHTS